MRSSGSAAPVTGPPRRRPAPSARLIARRAAPAGFADGADLVLVDEEIGLALARQAQHGVVKVLDPAAHGFAVAQLDGDNHLAVAERAQVERFLAGFARRRRLGAAARRQWEVILPF